MTGAAAAAAAVAAALALILLQLNCSAAAFEIRNCPPPFKLCGNATNLMPCVSSEVICDGNTDCPSGSDEKDCKTENDCSSSEFHCSRSGNCIDKLRKCNGKNDCKNGEDEERCSKMSNQDKTLCEVGQFTCNNANGEIQCLPKRSVCDNVKDCYDGADEKNCPCVKPSLSCDSGKTCLSPSKVCDDEFDCVDLNDEKFCNKSGCGFGTDVMLKNGKCTPYIHVCDRNGDSNLEYFDEVCPIKNKVCNESLYWTCKDGKHCIHKNAKCDGKYHCGDHSDELMDCNSDIEPLIETKSPKQATDAPCSAGERRCKSSSVCVSVDKFCKHEQSCPHNDDPRVDEECMEMKTNADPCRINNGNCEQKCSSDLTVSLLELRATCSCQPGYRVAKTNHTSCEDIDECQEVFGACSQICTNTVGSFNCNCRPGYKQKGSSCLANVPATVIIATNNKILQTVSGGSHSPSLLLANASEPTFLRADSANNYLYFYSWNSELLQRLRLKPGAQPEILLSNTLISDLVVDWWRNLLFFIENRTGGQKSDLMAMDLNTGKIAQLIQLDCPGSLAASPQTAQLFVSVICGHESGVHVIRLDRAPLQLKFLSIGGYRTAKPVHLTIDTQQMPNRLYWADNSEGRIFSSLLNGSQVRQHWPLRDGLQHKHESAASTLAVFEDKMLWVDRLHGILHSANKFVAKEATNVMKVKQIQSVALKHELLQPQPQPQQQRAVRCKCGNVCLALANSSSSGEQKQQQQQQQQQPQPMCFCDRNEKWNKLTVQCESRRPFSYNYFDTRSSSGSTVKLSAMKGHVGSVAGIVIGVLSACVLLLALLGAVCFKRSAAGANHSESAMHFGNDSFDYLTKAPGYSRLTKTTSQGTLNEENAGCHY